MKIDISEYVNVSERATELGCNTPTGLTILPLNFDTAKQKDDLLYRDTAGTVRKLWRLQGLEETSIEKSGDSFPLLGEREFEWVAPTLFYSWALISQNLALAEMAISIISDYLSRILRGLPPKKKSVRLDVVFEKADGECRKLHYEGDIDGLKDIPDAINSIVSDE